MTPVEILTAVIVFFGGILPVAISFLLFDKIENGILYRHAGGLVHNKSLAWYLGSGCFIISGIGGSILVYLIFT